MISNGLTERSDKPWKASGIFVEYLRKSHGTRVAPVSAKSIAIGEFSFGRLPLVRIAEISPYTLDRQTVPHVEYLGLVYSFRDRRSQTQHSFATGCQTQSDFLHHDSLNNQTLNKHGKKERNGVGKQAR